MKKLLTFVILGFAFASPAFAQGNLGQIGQYSAKLAHSGYDTVAQSFLLEETSFVNSFRLVVFSRYNTTDHPATLSVLEGDGPYGNIVFQETLNVKSLNKFFSEDTLASLTSNSQMEYMWVEVQNLIDSDVLGFDQMATDFNVGQYFPAGQYTVMVTLDTNIVNPFGYRWITSFTNCYNWPCASPYNIDPYPNGTHYWGADLLGLQSNARDMAFEVNAREAGVSTNVSDISNFFQGNVLTVPDDLSGSALFVHDVAGRELVSVASLVGGQQVQVPANQVVVVDIVSKEGVRKTTKLFRSDI